MFRTPRARLMALPAIAAATLLVGGTAVAAANEDTDTSTDCAALSAEANAAAEVALGLGLNLGVTQGEVDRLLGVIDSDSPYAELATEKLAAVETALDLRADATTCVDDEDDGTAEPTPTPQPGEDEDTDTGTGNGNEDEDTDPAATAPYYETCDDAREANAAPLLAGLDAGYRAELDDDGDGVACETPSESTDSGDSNATPTGSGGSYSQTGTVPVGSAETGHAG